MTVPAAAIWLNSGQKGIGLGGASLTFLTLIGQCLPRCETASFEITKKPKSGREVVPDGSPKKRRVVLDLAPSIYDELQEAAQQEDLSLHGGIHAAIRAWLDSEKRGS